jgi:phage regulator Rha-like protein
MHGRPLVVHIVQTGQQAISIRACRVQTFRQLTTHIAQRVQHIAVRINLRTQIAFSF